MAKDWAEHKITIIGLYRDQNKTLQDVRQIMKDHYQFDASTRAYRGQLKKWNIRKYTSRKNEAGQGGSSSASYTSSPNEPILQPNASNSPHDFLEEEQIPPILLTDSFNPDHSHHHRQPYQQTYQRRGSHPMNHPIPFGRSPNDPTLGYPDQAPLMARARSSQSRHPTSSHLMSSGYLQHPNINSDVNATRHLQYQRPYHVPNPNAQLPSPAPSPSFTSQFHSNGPFATFNMAASRPRPRTYSTPEPLPQHLALSRGPNYAHSNQDTRLTHYQRPLYGDQDTNYVDPEQFALSQYDFGGNEWDESQDGNVLPSYAPLPRSRRGQR